MGLGPNDLLTVFQKAVENGVGAVLGAIAGFLYAGSTVETAQRPAGIAGLNITYYSNQWVQPTTNFAALIPSFVVMSAIFALVGYAAGGVVKSLRAR